MQADAFLCNLFPEFHLIWLSMDLVPQRLIVWMNLQAPEKYKSIIFQSSVYRICLSCQIWCCMHFDVKN